nr:putative ribonuclease H-like domain-containing protein [Tanacetum cinerariifolium]
KKGGKPESNEPISVHLYRSMIGCLMYLTATRPYIMFAVCAAGRHQVTPKTSNLLSIKRIFKYLTAYPKLGLWYPRDSPFDLEAFSDSDYAGAHGDRKSKTDGCQFLGRRLISWQCKKQTIVATSSCKAEYVAAASCCGQWLLVTFAGRVIFCWSIVIPTGDLVPAVIPPDDLVSAGHILFLLVIYYSSCRTKFLMYPRFLQIILDTETEDTTPYPAPLVTKKFFANIRHYQGPDMPLLAHMLNQGEPALVQAQPQEVSLPLPSPVVEPHPSTDPMPSQPRPDIPSSSRPYELVLETITSPIRDDDTGGGSFPERPPSPSPATSTRSPTVGVAEEPLTLNSLLALFPTCLQRIATLKAELKATKILHRDAVVLFAKRIKKLESKLKTKKRKLVLSDSENEDEARKSQELDALLYLANAALHDPSASTTPSKPVNQEQSLEQEISPTTLDAVLTLSQSKTRARAAKIIYKRLKKQQSSSGLNFTDAAIPAAGRVSAAGVDPAVVISAGGADPAVVISAGLAVDLATAKDHHQQLKRSGETLESSESKKLKRSHSTEQSAELQETTSVSAGTTIAAGNPVFVVPSISAAFSIPAETPIAAGVSTTAGVSESAKQAVPLRKSSRKKSMARRRTLPRPSQFKSAALPFDEDDPEAEFKKYLQQVFDDDEPAKPISLSLVYNIRTWEIIPTEFGLGEIHVITRADGTVKRFSTLRELMYSVGRVDLMVLYGMVLDKYKLERATGIGLGLWSDLRTLITAREDRDASIIWDDQDQWEI